MATKPTNPKTPKGPAKPRGAGAKPKLVQPDEAGTEAKQVTGLRLKDLVDKVAAGTGLKKKDVKTAVEAALVQMGDALKAGESLNLMGFGRLRVVRSAAESGGAMTLKLRQGTPGEKGKKPVDAPLADAEDQD